MFLIASVVTDIVKTIKEVQIKGDGMPLWPFQFGNLASHNIYSRGMSISIHPLH